MDVKDFENSLNQYFQEGVETFLPHVSVNSVVLAYREAKLQVLVHRFQDLNYLSLPGGYIKRNESLDEAAYGNLGMLGIKEVFLRQIRTFGDVTRVFNFQELKDNISPGIQSIFKWVEQRFVTVVYYGLINLEETHVVPGGLIRELEWLDIDDLGDLAMDHAEIVTETRKVLANEVLNYPVAARLLSETFTLNELRGLFEAILNRPIDRGTFRRKILKLGLIEQVAQRKDNLGRPSHIFRFQKENYTRFLEEENKFGF